MEGMFAAEPGDRGADEQNGERDGVISRTGATIGFLGGASHVRP